MKRRPLLDREQLLIFASLAATTGLVGALVLLRLAQTGRASYGFLGWNTFLAWLPVFFGFAWRRAGEYGGSRFACSVWAAAWLCFLPNALYLVTDLQHFNTDHAAPNWYDALLFGANAINGSILACVALALGHQAIGRVVSPTRAWLAIVIVCLLCGFGIYLGRFPRLNSWDVVTNPLHVAAVIADRFVRPWDHVRTWFVTFVAGGLQLLCYVTLRGAAALQRSAVIAELDAARR